MNRGQISSINNSKSRPGIDHDTDHILVQAKIRVKTYTCQSKKLVVKHDIERLEDEEIKVQYTVYTGTKVELLLQSAAEDQSPDRLLNSIKHLYFTCADDILVNKEKTKQNNG